MKGSNVPLVYVQEDSADSRVQAIRATVLAAMEDKGYRDVLLCAAMNVIGRLAAAQGTTVAAIMADEQLSQVAEDVSLNFAAARGRA
jgi:hypothetical protein